MATNQKTSRKKSVFASPRYWYHLSSTLTRKMVYLTPWDNAKGFNRSDSEPDVHRTCVAPSPEHCLTAIPYCRGEKYVIYRTYHKTKATQAHGVFDDSVTNEGWIQNPCMFMRIGTIKLSDVAKGEDDLIEESASGDDVGQSDKVLAWWKRHHFRRYIKRH